MSRIFLTALILLVLPLIGFAKQSEGRKLAMDYEILLDTFDAEVGKGQCRIEVELYRNSGNSSFKGLELYYHDNNKQPVKLSDFEAEGTASAHLDPRNTRLFVKDPSFKGWDGIDDIPEGHLGYFTIYTSDIEFKSSHRVKIRFYMEEGYPSEVDKPIIYLYPEEETEVTVKIDPRGDLSFSYPQYNDGWTVTATPEGLLKTEERNYYYLFWEGKFTHKLLSAEDTRTGFVVKGSETQSFLEEILPKMGLSPTEYNEFIVYWTPQMQGNKYNFIHFKFSEAYAEDIAGIEVSPEPDNIFRVFMVYQPLFKSKDVEPQEIPKVSREGFTVIEWGGTKWTGLSN